MAASRKPERRAALELPYAREHEASALRAMDKGTAPKGLDQLVRWFREVCQGEAPVAIHKSGVWRDHGTDAEGGSHLGSPAWSDPFRRFLEGVDHPSALDPDGYYRWPLRAALSRMARRWPLTARALYQLALVDGDWRRLADVMSYPDEIMELYAERALDKLWREYSDTRMRT